jgi:hypothetical protein
VVLAAAGCAATVLRRRSRSRRHEPALPPVALPAQRGRGLAELGLRVEDPLIEEHEARDARLFDALDW